MPGKRHHKKKKVQHKFGDKVTELSPEEKTATEELFKKLSKRVYKYGYMNENIKPCIRIRDMNQRHSTIKTGEFPYNVGFMKHWECYPKSDLTDYEISHICGNATVSKQLKLTQIDINLQKRSLCIEGSHMTIEKHKDNMKRRTCHKYIRQFKKQFQKRNRSKYNDIITTGTITPTKINKILKNKLNNITLDGFTEHLECPHEKKGHECFINYGKIN